MYEQMVSSTEIHLYWFVENMRQLGHGFEGIRLFEFCSMSLIDAVDGSSPTASQCAD